MATYEQAIQALRNADAAGDVEAASRLAAIAQRLKSEQALGSGDPLPELTERPANVPAWTGPVDVDQGGDKGLLERAGDWIASQTNLRDTAAGGAMQGAADVGIGLGQLAANAVGMGDAVNPAVQQMETQYQRRRSTRGETGLDVPRLAGNITMSAVAGGAAGKGLPAALRARTAGGLGKQVAKGAATGAAYATTQPVTEGEYGPEKVKQAATGAVFGVAAPVVASAISPVGNAMVQALKARGVKSITPGQAAGPVARAAEDVVVSKGALTGPALRAARGRAQKEWNTATINEALSEAQPAGRSGGKALAKPGAPSIAPVPRIEGSGHAAIDKAHTELSGLYDRILGSVPGVVLSPQNAQRVATLRDATGGMRADDERRITHFMTEVFDKQLSPAGGFESKTFKGLDSDIGIEARKAFAEGNHEVGNYFLELRRILHDSLKETDPYVGEWLGKADSAFAKMVRVEDAAVRAMHEGGEFTPRQLAEAVKKHDKSGRKTQTARGKALMQDWATESEDVLGNVSKESDVRQLANQAGAVAQGAAALSGNPLAIGNLAVQAPIAAGYLAPKAREAIANALRKYGPMAAGLLGGAGVN